MQWVRLVKALEIKEFQLNSLFSPKSTPRSSPDLKLQSAYVQNWISNNVNEVYLGISQMEETQANPSPFRMPTSWLLKQQQHLLAMICGQK